jgi:hypothetical protein
MRQFRRFYLFAAAAIRQDSSPNLYQGRPQPFLPPELAPENKKAQLQTAVLLRKL